MKIKKIIPMVAFASNIVVGNGTGTVTRVALRHRLDES